MRTSCKMLSIDPQCLSCWVTLALYWGMNKHSDVMYYCMSEKRSKNIGGELEPRRELENTYKMNLLTNREAVIAAIAQIEGAVWAEIERENGQYSVDGALAEARKEKYGEGCIYGYGGTHRYFVRNDGSVYFSEGHGSKTVARAHELGFMTLSEAPPRWPNV